MSVAARLRRLDEGHEIVVCERSAHVSYANCGLPYHVGGVIEDRGSLILNTAEDLAARFGLDVRTGTDVLSIDRERHVVLAEELATGRRYEIAWDHLVLSPGAAPFVPYVPGAERALTLRTVEDMDRLVAAVRRDKASTAVVVGGGFIGLETAENLARAGLAVTIVELAPQVLAPLDAELAQLVADELDQHGVGLVLGTALAKVLPDAVELTDGQVLPADIVVLAIGVRPETTLARASGLAIGPRGGISVDERLRTSDPHVYAVGDAVEKTDLLSNEPVLVPLANIANRQGRMVADDIAGRPRPFGPVQGTAVIKVFSKVAAVTGWNEKRLRATGQPYLAIHTHPGSHAGYYPGTEPMALKLLVDPGTQAILGAEAVGGEGVDKRMDVLATAIRAGMPAPALVDLELTYAPQFGSAKDPVNLLGYVAENRLNGNERSVQWHELAERMAAGAVLVDARTPAEHARGHIPGSVNFALDELRARRAELSDLAPSGGDLIVYCQVGQRAHTATRLLASWGYQVANLDGGYLTWSAATRAQLAALVSPHVLGTDRVPAQASDMKSRSSSSSLGTSPPPSPAPARH
jgi:NADPH-dependent 2,4-dienoyl-CoA reductase/sulfur reductase-like enzyme/rhodanese-related sulfurtransferase